MTQPVAPHRRFTAAGVATTLAGLALLVWVILRVGPAEIAADVRQVGWGVAAVIALGGLRFLLRALAWRLCLDDPGSLSIADAFSAVVSGDAIGNLTPLGPLVGEPAKAALVRGRVPMAPAVTALAVENLLYTLSAAAMIAAGMIALLLTFELPSNSTGAVMRDVGEIAIGGTVALFGLALWLLWRQPALVSRALGVSPRLGKHADRIRTIEVEIYSFASRHPGALLPVGAAEIGFHALGVAEVYVTLWLLSGAPPPLMTSFLFETANRLLQVVFKFVPLRLGVDEAGTAGFATMIGVAATTGLSLAIVRKVRVLFWAAAGGLLLVRRGVRLPAR
ncbi:MAG TPA: hypothetical protein VH138_15300 [Vicinamibacterales bacterium]|nr:hypothetical protein [Vicinamibacterales bacterium]